MNNVRTKNSRQLAVSTSASSAYLSISKLQNVLCHIQQTTELAKIGILSTDHMKAGRALTALGLCQQALESVSAACQNLGFSVNSLMSIKLESQDSNSAAVERQLKEAKIEIVKLLTQKLGVSRESVFIAIQSFADESAVISALMLARAEQYLRA